MSDVTTFDPFPELTRRASVAMTYRARGRKLRRDARLAFANGCDAVGARALLAFRLVDRAANAEMRNRPPEGLA